MKDTGLRGRKIARRSTRLARSFWPSTWAEGLSRRARRRGHCWRVLSGDGWRPCGTCTFSRGHPALTRGANESRPWRTGPYREELGGPRFLAALAMTRRKAARNDEGLLVRTTECCA